MAVSGLLQRLADGADGIGEAVLHGPRRPEVGAVLQQGVELDGDSGQQLGEAARRLRLVKAGREFKACCPFHDEKSPSFFINDRKGFFHCFGCGAHGDVIDLLRRLDGLDFAAAVEALSGERPALRRNTALEFERRMMAATEEYTAAEGRGWEPDEDERARMEHARAIWFNARPIAGTVAETYLRWRGIRLAPGSAYRQPLPGRGVGVCAGGAGHHAAPSRSEGTPGHRSADRRCGGARAGRHGQRHRQGGAARGEGVAVIGIEGAVRVLVAAKPVDFRKGMDGLAALVQQQLGADPFSGVVYVFRSKRADRVKLLHWDGTGLVLIAKRLEAGQFRWPAIRDGVIRLTPAQLSALVEGLDWTRVRGVRVSRPTSAS